MERKDLALKYFYDGYNCAQAVFAAYCDLFGMDPDLGKTLCSGMGAGMGGLREKCGAVSSMFLLAGLLSSSKSNEEVLSKKELYKLIKELNQDFEGKMGSSCCRTLLENANVLVLQNPSERNEKYYKKRPCAIFVKTASEIIQEKLLPFLLRKPE